MTNKENYEQLSENEKELFNTIYKQHPLKNYINWEKYFNSEDGNSLDFINCIYKYKNNLDETVYILKRTDNTSYLAFISNENKFYTIPETILPPIIFHKLGGNN